MVQSRYNGGLEAFAIVGFPGKCSQQRPWDNFPSLLQMHPFILVLFHIALFSSILLHTSTSRIA